MAASTDQPANSLERERRRDDAAATTIFHSNLDAMAASSRAMIHGFEAVGSEVLAFAQSQARDVLEAGRRLADCRSPETVLAIQIDFMRCSLEAWTDEVGRISEIGGKVVDETLSPLAARVPQT